MIRMLVPFSRRCVAKLCRKVYSVTFLVKPAASTADRQAPFSSVRPIGRSSSQPGNKTLLGRTSHQYGEYGACTYSWRSGDCARPAYSADRYDLGLAGGVVFGAAAGDILPTVIQQDSPVASAVGGVVGLAAMQMVKQLKSFTRGLLIVLGGMVLISQGISPSYAQPADTDPEDYINPDRPGIADGSNVVGARRLQIETAIQQEFRGNASSHTEKLFIPTLVRFGLDKNWELRLEGNTYTLMTEHDATQGTVHSEGAAPTSVGLKYHFIESAGVERPSVGAIVRVFPQSGSGDFRSLHTTGDFRVAADWDFAPQWSLNPNLGVAVNEDDKHRSYTAGLFAATLNYNPSKTLNFFIDTGIQSPEERHGKSSVICDAGIAYIIGHDIQIDLSVGYGAAGTTPPRPFLAAGISKRF